MYKKNIVVIGLSFVLAIMLFIITGMYNNAEKQLSIQIQKTNELNTKLIESQNNYERIVNIRNQKIIELSNIQNQIHWFNDSFDNAIDVIASAYDLSVVSCGKRKYDKAYGVTRQGVSLKGLNWESARVIAVDPKVIPLGSIVHIEFTDRNFQKYSNIYYALDTGSAIKGNKIDFFYEDTGDNKVSRGARNFGITKAKVIILK